MPWSHSVHRVWRDETANKMDQVSWKPGEGRVPFTVAERAKSQSLGSELKKTEGRRGKLRY